MFVVKRLCAHRNQHVITPACPTGRSSYDQTDKTQYHFCEETSAQRDARVKAKLPGYDISFQSGTRDESKFIIAAHNDRTPGSRYIYDDASDTLDKLADINPLLAEGDMAPVQPIQYVSRDGLTIHGYLTLPLGRPAQGLPCIEIGRAHV